MSLHHFIDELKRRHVFRVAGFYLVGAWGVIEAVTGMSELFTHSEAPGRIVAILAIAGFPVALALAWFFDLTRQGIVRTADITQATSAAAESPAHGGRQVLSAKATGMFGLGMLVALLSFAGYTILTRSETADVKLVRTLAVLPLEGYADSAYADALTEELIRRLSREDSLEVTARTSAFRFKGTEESVSDVARQLGVQAVIAGSVRRLSGDIIVTIELVDGPTGRVLWSPEPYRVAEKDAFQVQETIAADLLEQLTVGAQAKAAGSSVGTRNEMAAKLYTLGLERLNRRTDRDLREALSYFQRATQADREYADAFAGLAQTYALLPTVGDFDAREAFTQGMTAASMAISLDPMSGEAHAAVGQLVQNYDWQPSASLRSYERAIEFSPSHASAHQWFAEALMLLGRLDEAEREAAAAVKLDPLSPAALNTQAQVQVARGEYESAVATLLSEVSLFPDFRYGSMTLALTAVLAQRYPEMERALQAYAGDDAATQAALARVAAGVKNPAGRAAAKQALRSLEPRIGISMSALWYAALGDNAAAMDALQRAYANRADPNLPYVLVHPLLKGLHGMKAYQDIVADIGVVAPNS